MQGSLLETSSATWDHMLARCCHDCYHTPGWYAAAERIEHGSAAAVLVTDGCHELLAPLIRRPLSCGRWDATTAYGYGGPLVSPEAPSGFANEAFGAAVALLRKHGCVSWFIRLHPLLNTDWESSYGRTIEHGSTVSIGLTKSAERLWQETQSRHRHDIIQARRAGVSVRLDRDFEALPRFIALYNQTMTRVGALPYYFFDASYYRTLVRMLGKDLLLFVAEQQGRVIGAALFTLARRTGIMQYHMCGWDWEYRHWQPTKTLIHAAREWGRTHTMRCLHLGGGLGAANDSLQEFKRGFSPDTHVYRTQRLVLDLDHYLELSGEDDSAELNAYFPAYRRPGARFSL